MRRLTRPLLSSLILLAMLLSSDAISQARPVIRVWPGDAPGESLTGEPETFEDDRVYHVNDPTLTAVLPRDGSANGAAVIVCPGGAYRRLAIGHEGWEVAEWLASLGYAAFVLKYRMYDYGQPAPAQDIQRAVRVVRSRAAEWNIDFHRIGVMGFSAGGHVVSSAATHFADHLYGPVDSIDQTSARPDFAVLIYPVISMEDSVTHAGSKKNLLGENPSPALAARWSNDRHVTPDTPPSFIVHATNDTGVPVENSLRFYRALVGNGVSAELHVFGKGGHGFGLGRGHGAVDAWPGLCERWMEGLWKE